MGIVEEDIQRVKQATDLVGVASEHLAVRKAGRSWVGLCPFHQEKTPSFSINAEEGFYYCFGCQASGDVIRFVMELDHLDFPNAVERLAARAGINLRYDDANESQDRSRRARMVAHLEAAVEWYHQRLLTSPDAGRARGYLRERGIGGDVVREFKIGWAPDDWDSLARSLKLDEDALEGTGLGFLNKAGRKQDSFRARILFPIFDPAGKPIGFGGRIMPGGDGPKYKNTQETAVYRKSQALYGLNWAKADAVAADEVIVCEGYTDVIGFHQAGIPRAVATCGTSLTEDHARILRRFARRVVLAFDADAAGQAASAKFYEWEQAHDLDVVVADLPPGRDPGELATSDPALLAKAVDGALPFLGFRLHRMFDEAELGTPEGRARAAGHAMVAINEHPNPLVRDQYMMEVADRAKIDVARLRAGDVPLPRAPRGVRQPNRGDGASRRPESRRGTSTDSGEDLPPPPDDRWDREADDSSRPLPQGVRTGVVGSSRSIVGSSSGPSDTTDTIRMKDRRPATPGAMAICLAIKRLDDVTPMLDPVLLPDDVHRAAFAALVEHGGLRDAVDHAPSGASELLAHLGTQETEADVLDVCALLAYERAAEAMADLQLEARRSSDPTAFAQLIAWLKLRMEELRSERGQADVLPVITAWLTTQEG